MSYNDLMTVLIIYKIDNLLDKHQLLIEQHPLYVIFDVLCGKAASEATRFIRPEFSAERIKGMNVQYIVH